MSSELFWRLASDAVTSFSTPLAFTPPSLMCLFIYSFQPVSLMSFVLLIDKNKIHSTNQPLQRVHMCSSIQTQKVYACKVTPTYPAASFSIHCQSDRTFPFSESSVSHKCRGSLLLSTTTMTVISRNVYLSGEGVNSTLGELRPTNQNVRSTEQTERDNTTCDSQGFIFLHCGRCCF